MPKVGSVGRLDGGSSTSDVHVIFGDPNHCVDDNNSPTIRDPLHDQSTDLRTERSPDSAATIRAAAIAANQSDESLSKHSAAIDNLQKQMEELKKKLSSSLEDHKLSMEEFYKKFLSILMHGQMIAQYEIPPISTIILIPLRKAQTTRW